MDSPTQPPPGQPSPEFLDAVRRRKRSSQAFSGVILIVVGLMFLVDRLSWDWSMHFSIGREWPVILIVIGLGMMLSHQDGDLIVQRTDEGPTRADFRPRGRRRFGDGMFMILIGVIMLLHMNHVMYLSHSWPLFIVAAGLSVMFGRGERRRPRREYR